LAIAACAGAGADDSVRPLLRSELAAPASLTTATLAETEQWAPDTPAGPPLPAFSSAAEIKNAVVQAHGRTGDVAEEVNRFVFFPPVPTPARAELTELRADVRIATDGQSDVVTAEVTFNADGSVDELVALYRDHLTDLGWEDSERSDHSLTGVLTRHVTFEIPDTPYPRDDFTVVVRQERVDLTDGLSSDDGLRGARRAEVTLRYVELVDTDDSTFADRFVGWAEGLPLPEGGEVTGAGIQTSAVGRHSLHYSLALSYDGLTSGRVADELRAGLPTGAFALEAHPPTGDVTDNWVYLLSPFFDEARVSTHAVGTTPGPPTRVNVDARIGFTPAS
jgi:hypothetical protein